MVHPVIGNPQIQKTPVSKKYAILHTFVILRHTSGRPGEPRGRKTLDVRPRSQPPIQASFADAAEGLGHRGEVGDAAEGTAQHTKDAPPTMQKRGAAARNPQ